MRVSYLSNFSLFIGLKISNKQCFTLCFTSMRLDHLYKFKNKNLYTNSVNVKLCCVTTIVIILSAIHYIYNCVDNIIVLLLILLYFFNYYVMLLNITCGFDPISRRVVKTYLSVVRYLGRVGTFAKHVSELRSNKRSLISPSLPLSLSISV